MKIADDFVAVMLQKDVIELNGPSFIGQAVLDLSKLRMYHLQYVDLEKYRLQFQCTINIVAGDTDSFFLECKKVHLGNELLPAMITDGLLDTSNYETTHPLYTTKNAKIGNFKDENKNKVTYLEWIFLRPKCYSLLSDSKPSMKAKGINLKQTIINHSSYREAYESGVVVSAPPEEVCEQTTSALYHKLLKNRLVM
jgi:hypothetical protein